MDKYSHRERLHLILAGDKPDRFAASFWRHFYHKEHYAEGTAEATVAFQKRFDWDFIKINPRAEYHNEGWGLKLEWSHEEFTKHQKTVYPVSTIDDWNRIEPLKLSTPVLDEHLRVVSLVRKGVGKDVPILMTVFTPLAVAGRMMSEQKDLVEHLHQKPEKVEQALQAITETFQEFVTELRNAGADGIFYATTLWASSDMVTWEEYQRFGVPYDLEVIKASGDDALNLLHVCSANNFLKELAEIDYHCQLYNWDSDNPTNLPLDKVTDLLKDRTLVGGVDQHGWLLKSSAEEIGLQIEKIKQRHDPARLIIGPGCSIPPEVPMENLQAIRHRL